MKRDMDLIRELLLAIEHDPQYNAVDTFTCDSPADFGIVGSTLEEVAYHLQLMIDNGLIRGRRSSMVPVFGGLTMEGHDFLDSIRDPEIWSKTKDVAKRAGGFSLKLLGDLAAGLIKTQVKRLTGVDV